MLSLAIGALQLMLDRGGEVDWFSSTEIWVYLLLTISGLWVFVIHIFGAKKPFLDPRMFTDRNFVTGLIFIFVIGIILLASLTLLPPMLARIFGYPTITTSIVMGPRGIGTMASMISYIDDFRLMMMVALCAIPLALMLRTPAARAPAAPMAHADCAGQINGPVRRV